MKARVEISSYVDGRYNSSKLEKLKQEIDKNFSSFRPRQNQEFPENGVLITINMSAKYQTLYVKCEEWGKYLSVGELEDLIIESIENRGFEVTGNDGDDCSFKIDFE